LIVIKVFGGLGNQLFQYAFGRALSIKLNTELYLDLSWFDENTTSTKRVFQLDLFNTKFLIADKLVVGELKPLYFRLINSILVKFNIGRLQLPAYFIENGIYYNQRINIIKENSYINGYWQSEKYFVNVHDVIKNEFVFKDIPLNSLNSSLLNEIRLSQSVAVHVRRSDYNLSHNIDIHGVLPISYYEQSMKTMQSYVKNAFFFVFSDDVDWAKKALSNKFQNIRFISENPSYVDFYLNSNCKNNIIANSTFSWWSAWLNENPDKKVIAPKNWYSNIDLNNATNDLYPNSWIRI